MYENLQMPALFNAFNVYIAGGNTVQSCHDSVIEKRELFCLWSNAFDSLLLMVLYALFRYEQDLHSAKVPTTQIAGLQKIPLPLEPDSPMRQQCDSSEDEYW